MKYTSAMKYTSISRNFRGFNHQTDWDTIEAWEKAMIDQITLGNNEIEWSILISVIYGDPIRRYNRSAGVKQISAVEVKELNWDKNL